MHGAQRLLVARRARPVLGVRVASPQALAALHAAAAVVDQPAAHLVADQHRRALGLGQVAVAPVHHGDHHRPQVEPLLGEEVLVAGRALLVRALLEDVLLNQPREPVGEHVARDAEVVLDLVEAPAAVEDVADDEQRPALAEHLEGACDRTRLVVIAIEHECDCRTLGCITQLSLLAFGFVKQPGRRRPR